MTVAHEAIAACGLDGGASAHKTATRNMLTKRMAYVIADNENPQDLVPLDPDTGVRVIDVIFNGRLYHYDSTDSTTAHDGVTCLVLSGGGRYKLANGSDVDVYAVLSFTTTTPPGSPAIGDAYLLPAGCSGVWAGHEGSAAVYTARGWEYITVSIGRPIYVEDVSSYYHRNALGNWTLGLGAQLFTSGSVSPSALLNYKAGGILKVVNKTTNSPPGSPAIGDAYVIGSSPTGAWAGKSYQVAVYESNGWAYYAPSAGDEVYDTTLGSKAVYSGTAWVTSVLGLELIATQTASGVASIDFTGLDNTYESYAVVLDAIKPVANSVSFGMRVGTGATPTWITSGYGYAQSVNVDGSSVLTPDLMSSTAADRIILGADGTGRTVGSAVYSARLGNATGANLRCRIEFSKPADSNYIMFDFKGSYVGDGGDLIAFSGSGMRRTVGAITALRFLCGSNNISTGRISLYGLRKS